MGLNKKGFTLIEIMAVLVIMSVLAAVAVKKVGAITDSAKYRALMQGVVELNSREYLSWVNMKFAPGGYTDDADLWGAVNTDLGDVYTWSAGPDLGGGTLAYNDQQTVLTRTGSTAVTAAKWQ
jgi:prepilin-type N-terminal cleavage/methylation domain-containing protein